MQGVFANRNEKRDFVINELVSRAESGCDVYIASAFFTTSEVIHELITKGCNVKMVIRLGFPTSPTAIEQVYKHPKVQLRYFTSRSFHPKIYIFGDDAALVGSANLTNAALMTNQEVMVTIDSGDDRLIELMCIFEDYFNQAEVMTSEDLLVYKRLYDEFAKHDAATYALGDDLLKKLGDKAPNNIDRGGSKQNKKSIFASNFRRSYQEGVKAFDIVKNTYAAYGYRKADPNLIPLRVEIDSFISFVRETVAIGESWKAGPLRNAEQQIPFITELIQDWGRTPWPHFEDTIVGLNYPRLKTVLGSPESIMTANDSDLFDGLATLHSFHDRFRFFEGGLATFKREFPTFNDPSHVRKTLNYLIYGPGDIVDRMANAIFDPRYKLKGFGRANVQELIGWLSREELPMGVPPKFFVISDRTSSSLMGDRLQALPEM